MEDGQGGMLKEERACAKALRLWKAAKPVQGSLVRKVWRLGKSQITNDLIGQVENFCLYP
jgi:hypothetical protein